MADPTATERARRYRAHKRGDHSLCLPGRADCGEPAVTASQASSRVTDHGGVAPPAGLAERGRRLWRATVPELSEITLREQVLLEEACRLADRLDVLDRILRGDESAWMRLHSMNDDGSIVKVVLNNALSEARQQQVALKQLLAELRQGRAATKQAPAARKPPPAGTGGEGGGGIADLTARIAQRAQSAG